MSPRQRRPGRRGPGGDAPADHIAGVLDAALRELGVHRQVREVQLREAFAETVGPALAPLCQAISLERGTLLVATRSGALAHQLHLEMPVITATLNRRLGSEQVKRLRFTPLG
jgi:predicted nucleic acid-binding Zn ribbon protein